MTEYRLIDPDGEHYDLADRATLLRFLAHWPEIGVQITVEEPWTLVAKIPHRGKVNEDDRPDSAA